MGVRHGGETWGCPAPGAISSSAEEKTVTRTLAMIAAVMAIICCPILRAPALAQQRTLIVAGYGGSFEQALRSTVFPPFAAKHGVRIEYAAGNSTDTLAKLQAQKANQVIDVAIVDDGPMYQAIQLGFCAKIEGLATGDLYDTAKFKGDMAVAVGQTGTGFMVNTKAFKDKGWPVPTSWNDLK